MDFLFFFLLRYFVCAASVSIGCVKGNENCVMSHRLLRINKVFTALMNLPRYAFQGRHYRFDSFFTAWLANNARLLFVD